MKQGLIIVDVQNDYFEGGSMTLSGMDEAAANCRQLLDSFRRRRAPLFHIQHLAQREGATFFVPGTTGCEIHDSVKPDSGETVIVKHFPSAFRDTDLADRLASAEVEEVVICGAMSHMCIDSTVRAAFDLGFRCIVAADACTTRDLEFDGRLVAAEQVQAAFMAALAVPFAQILSTQQYIEVL